MLFYPAFEIKYKYYNFINNICLWFITKIHMAYFLYKNIYTAHYFLISTQPDVSVTKLFNRVFH